MNKKFFKLFLLISLLSLFSVNCSKNNPTNPEGEGTTPPSGSKRATVKIVIGDFLYDKVQSAKFNNQVFNVSSIGGESKEIIIPDNGDYVYLTLNTGIEIRTEVKFTPDENGSGILDQNECQIKSSDSMIYEDSIGKTISDSLGNFINNYGVIEFKNNTGFIDIYELVWSSDQLISGTFGTTKSVKVFAKPASSQEITITLKNINGGRTTGELKGPYTVTKGKVTTIELTSETPAKSGQIDSTLYNVYADKVN